MNPLLGTWTLNANGRRRILSITAIDPVGKLDIALEDVPVIGYWDKATRRILFHGPTKTPDSPAGYFTKTYVGYLLALDQGTKKEVPTLAGYFHYHHPERQNWANTQHKKSFGWYAQLTNSSAAISTDRDDTRNTFTKTTAISIT